MGSTLKIERLDGRFGVEIKDIDVPKISDEDVKDPNKREFYSQQTLGCFGHTLFGFAFYWFP